jgi:hypothetical protein
VPPLPTVKLPASGWAIAQSDITAKPTNANRRLLLSQPTFIMLFWINYFYRKVAH